MRLQINVSDDMVQRIDYWAKKIGVSRSSFCAMAIGNAVMGYDKSVELMQEWVKTSDKDISKTKHED